MAAHAVDNDKRMPHSKNRSHLLAILMDFEEEHSA